mgnify:CR=1 FL=1
MKSRVAKADSRSAVGFLPRHRLVAGLRLDLGGYLLCNQRIAQPQPQQVDDPGLPHQGLSQAGQRIDLPFVDSALFPIGRCRPRSPTSDVLRPRLPATLYCRISRQAFAASALADDDSRSPPSRDQLSCPSRHLLAELGNANFKRGDQFRSGVTPIRAPAWSTIAVVLCRRRHFARQPRPQRGHDGIRISDPGPPA